ncbi:RMD1 family protein [Gilvibacter sediminis]|uniref:RMD1 family protein n=1 Tax=Gilvibacter sediminis TaxID=379071 RepID=UPI0023505C2B|nr:RMD1 family protein [Gilvibacter sediminis]MDC7996439.1 RMD1 family protein [Gilvibacter sediminis]
MISNTLKQWAARAVVEKHTAFACHMALGFNLKELQKKWADKVLHSDADGILLGFDTGYAAVFRYGVVVHWKLSPRRREILESYLKAHSRGLMPAKNWRKDQLLLAVNEPNISVNYEEVVLDNSSTEMVHLVLLHLAQSVALDSFSYWSEKLLEDTRRHTTELELKGKISLKGTKLKKYIGKVLNLRNKVSENLYIIDAPDLVWDDPALEALHKKLVLRFDLKDRYRSIQEQLSIVKENLDLFKELSFHRESSTLEWIIILLILIEVIDMFIMK